ncbi:MAG: hypothetical protein C4523_15180 [Myxococcales bacterium]|nr:MAG: hypothetical protein C4523_15180 [Myxococcales bacterium]
MIRQRLTGLAAIVVLLFGGVPQAAAQNALPSAPAVAPTATPLPAPTNPSPATAALVKNVQDYYLKAGDFSARFTQRYHSKLTRRVSESGGTVEFAKPVKMRWEYDPPDRKAFISDGQTLWVVHWEEKSATVHPDLKSSELESSLGFLWGGGDLLLNYAVNRLDLPNVEGIVETKGRIVLELVPKKPAQFDTLYLLVDPASYRIEEAVLVDSLGNLNHLAFTAPKTRLALGKDRFVFTPPPGWTVEKTGGSTP